MNTRTRKLRIALILAVGLACQSSLQAQFVIPFSLTQTSPAVTYSLDSNGIFLSSGPYTGTSLLTSGEEGAGTRMLWNPGKASFRAGYVAGTDWDDANMGTYSVALGYNTIASNYCTVAMNEYTTASGSESVAMNQRTIASGVASTAMGASSTASGQFSVAMGYITLASGNSSVSTGAYAVASGDVSTAAGRQTLAGSYLSFALGAFNVGLSSTGATPNATSWVATDPLFEIGVGGNGSQGNPAINHTADALVVYKNGNAILQGTLQAAPGGDIPMFTGY